MSGPASETARHITPAITMDHAAALAIYSTLSYMAATFGVGAVSYPLRADPCPSRFCATASLAGVILLSPAARIANAGAC